MIRVFWCSVLSAVNLIKSMADLFEEALVMGTKQWSFIWPIMVSVIKQCYILCLLYFFCQLAA